MTAKRCFEMWAKRAGYVLDMITEVTRNGPRRVFADHYTAKAYEAFKAGRRSVNGTEVHK